MSAKLSNWILAAIFLIAVVLITHLYLVPSGLGIMTTEWAVFSLVAEDMRHGHFTSFPMGQDYAGLTFTAFRALFCSLWEFFDSSTLDYLRSHLVFSYLLTPVLVTGACYYLACAFASRTAAFITGIICAIGFHFWVLNYGNDFYFLYFIGGCLLAAWRTKYSNPFIELSPTKLLGLGIFIGHLYYTSPVTGIYSLAFFLPLPWAWNEFLQLFKVEKFYQKFLLFIGSGLIILFFYLEIFDRDLGVAFGKVIKLDAKPNLKLGLYFWSVLWISLRYKAVTRDHLRRAVNLALGFGIGFLPEILYFLRYFFVHGHFKQRIFTMETYDFKTSMQVVGLIPSALRTLLAGDQGIGQNASLLLFSFGFAIFIFQCRKNSKLHPVLLTGALAFFLYCRIRTYVQPIAPPRYLFPAFPFFIVVLATLWDQALKSKSRIAIFILSAITVVHLTHQLGTRWRLIQSVRASEKVENVFKVVEAFRKEKVDIVISDDFLHQNIYTLVAKRAPLFWSRERRWGPWIAETMSYREKRVGLLFRANNGITTMSTQESMLGRNFHLSSLGQIGDRLLFVGTTEEVATPPDPVD